jgi:hypothetical protein
MLLSSQYRTLRAVFDRVAPALEEGSPYFAGRGGRWSFQVGPFQYVLDLIPSPDSDGEYDVEFAVEKFNGNDHDLTRHLEKVWGRPVSDSEVVKFKRDLRFHSTGILNTRNAFQVLASVFDIVQSFVMDNYVHTLTFSSEEESRTDLYRRVIKRFLPGKRIIEDVYRGRTYFKVYLDEDYLGEDYPDEDLS